MPGSPHVSGGRTFLSLPHEIAVEVLRRCALEDLLVLEQVSGFGYYLDVFDSDFTGRHASDYRNFAKTGRSGFPDSLTPQFNTSQLFLHMYHLTLSPMLN
jgi:hypothetical protein